MLSRRRLSLQHYGMISSVVTCLAFCFHSQSRDSLSSLFSLYCNVSSHFPLPLRFFIFSRPSVSRLLSCLSYCFSVCFLPLSIICCFSVTLLSCHSLLPPFPSYGVLSHHSPSQHHLSLLPITISLTFLLSPAHQLPGAIILLSPPLPPVLSSPKFPSTLSASHLRRLSSQHSFSLTNPASLPGFQEK